MVAEALTGVSAPHEQSSAGTVSARSRAFRSAFTRLGYDAMPPKTDRRPKVEKPPQLVGLDRGKSVYRWARCIVTSGLPVNRTGTANVERS
jgi:hypothetical protein